MTDGRRFSTPEIQEVFSRAAAAQERADRESADLGLTLDELQAAGVEAGLDPVHIAAAARAVASGEPDEGRDVSFGIPMGVHRAATLEFSPSDALWDEIVADVRETFAARGRTERIGEARIWRNGNLRVSIQPAGEGTRLRLRTNRRNDTQGLLTVGAVNAVMAAVFAAMPNGDPDTAPLLAVVAVFSLAFAWIRQSLWVRTRERQMDEVAARVQRLTRAPRPAVSDSHESNSDRASEEPRIQLLDPDRQQEANAPSSRRVRA